MDCDVGVGERIVSLPFTGERVVPGLVEHDLFAEHLARYSFVASMVRGGRVLDAGCGSGYGVARLTRNGATVVGIDCAEEAIRYARVHYGGAERHFCVADAMCLPFADHSFDLIVSFEVIEHLRDYHGYLKELGRVLSPSGILVISTPNKRRYRDAQPDYVNPFHVREFTFQEFEQALREHFPVIAWAFQVPSDGQLFLGGPTQPPQVPPTAEYLQPLELSTQALAETAEFFLACCGHQEPAVAELRDRCYLAGRLNGVVVRDRWIGLLRGEVARRDEIIRGLQAALEEQTAWAKRSAEEVVQRDTIIRDLQAALEGQVAEVARLRATLANVLDELRAVQSSWVYRAFSFIQRGLQGPRGKSPAT